METLSFEEAMFLKNLCNDFAVTTQDLNGKAFTYPRRIRPATYSDKLREFVTTVRYDIKETSTNILEMINKYKNFYNEPNLSNKEAFEKIIEKINSFRRNVLKYGENYVDINTPFDSVLKFAKVIIKTCDRIIEFDNMAHKVEETEETKFNKTTAEAILKSSVENDGWTRCIDNEFEKIESEFKAKNIDVYSPDYWKLCSKRLRAVKSEVYSIVNKYFGQSSKLGEFHLMDQLI